MIMNKMNLVYVLCITGSFIVLIRFWYGVTKLSDHLVDQSLFRQVWLNRKRQRASKEVIKYIWSEFKSCWRFLSCTLIVAASLKPVVECNELNVVIKCNDNIYMQGWISHDAKEVRAYDIKGSAHHRNSCDTTSYTSRFEQN